MSVFVVRGDEDTDSEVRDLTSEKWYEKSTLIEIIPPEYRVLYLVTYLKCLTKHLFRRNLIPNEQNALQYIQNISQKLEGNKINLNLLIKLKCLYENSLGSNTPIFMTGSILDNIESVQSEISMVSIDPLDTFIDSD